MLKAILSELVVERRYANVEQKDAAPDQAAELERFWPDGVALNRIAYDDLKARSQKARAVVRTGEFTPYTNVILVAGVPF